MDYLKFKAWFESERSTIQLPSDCTELQPRTKLSGWFVWTFTWYLMFTPDRYLRMSEHYDRWPELINTSRRTSFAYHYGPVVRVGADGVPERDSADPVDIRIDNARGPAHLHFGSPNPHYQQSEVEGLQLGRVDMFTFLKAILRHRSANCTIEKALGFRIR